MSTPSSDPEQRVQEDLYRLEAYRSQLNALLQQHQLLSASRQEHQRARETLEGIERTTASTELLIPLGAESFLRGSSDPAAKVLVGIGSGVVVELERPKVSELLAQRLKRLDQAAEDLEGQIRTVEERVQVINQRLEAATQGPGRPGETSSDDVGGD